jgi:hypothetical protein
MQKNTHDVSEEPFGTKIPTVDVILNLD